MFAGFETSNFSDAELICLPSGSIEVAAPEPRPAATRRWCLKVMGCVRNPKYGNRKKSYERKTKKSYYSRLMVNYAKFYLLGWYIFFTIDWVIGGWQQIKGYEPTLDTALVPRLTSLWVSQFQAFLAGHQ